ncbi:GAF sensor signal transduction histidine kinase [[Leptolyngbya] sp. PCC 7376]|uniref:sensor histidine kinase n=1 Tax=[Leptolyngbya] sp. PCC 7376 TaxID=111781 RepID=UPI00029F331F|nr:sensor histidine kinase [[Leptolyngbya] sp. PCC 7376]AFY39499.1 GAF sensor signal transduction histidine kinase [[Leptolyngbya] sp. PCC 7376]
MTAMNQLENNIFPIPSNEAERLDALEEYQILDSLPEQSFDDLTAIAAQICGTPIALISLVDKERQWFKSRQGIDATETPRGHSFCTHAIMDPEEVLVVPNALEDPRFLVSPLVKAAPHIRFYAGAPLVNPDGYALGTLCVIDDQPRNLSDAQKTALEALSRQVVSQLELFKQTNQLQHQVEVSQQKQEVLEDTLEQLKQTQTSLIHAEKMSTLGHLVRGIAHEVNNPVNFIFGNLKSLEDYATDLFELLDQYQNDVKVESPELAELKEEIDLEYLRQDFPNLFDSMLNGAERIRNIVKSLRLFSRLGEEGNKNINLNENLDATLDLLKAQLDEQGSAIELVRDYDENLPSVICNIGSINHVVMLMLHNAIDALAQGVGAEHESPHQATISVSTKQCDGEYIYICISDNAAGISEALQEKIFEPFFSTKPIGEGTGLGLAICQQVVAQHNGKLLCKSEIDVGTTFEIILPTNTTSF